MKKIFAIMLTIFLVALIIVYGLFVLKDGTSLFSNSAYTLSKIKEININSLSEINFFNNGILTYNKDNTIFYNLNGEKIWEKNNNEFPKFIYLNKFIYKTLNNKISVMDYKGKEKTITLVDEDVLSITDENNYFSLITRDKNNNNACYVYGNSFELLSQIKELQHKLINVNYDDKTKKLLTTSFYMKNNSMISNLEFCSLNGDKLWNKEINNEVVISTYFNKNDIIIITDKSICLINKNGELLWQSNCFNRLIDFKFDEINKCIYLLAKNDENRELLKITIEGKIADKIILTEKFDKLKIIENDIYLSNNNNVAVINKMKQNTLFNTKEEIKDYNVFNNKLYILFNNKFVEGDIINK